MKFQGATPPSRLSILEGFITWCLLTFRVFLSVINGCPSIFKHAKGLKQEFQTVTLKLDKLCLNGKQFTTANLEELPKSLMPESRAVKKTDETVVFYSLHSVFSNFHNLEVKVEGKTYCCNEQYLQNAKALLFGDEVAAANIMNETDPYVISSLGKKVRGYRKEVWEGKAYEILKNVNHFKYAQHPDAAGALLDTGNRKLGEASPQPLNGTGVPLSSPSATDQSTWVGKNWMGQILMEIRDELVDKM